jgi:hypothetical protein
MTDEHSSSVKLGAQQDKGRKGLHCNHSPRSPKKKEVRNRKHKE